MPANAADPTHWYLELRDDSVDEEVARRAIALELREVELPSDPRRESETSDDVSLFVSVERQENGLFVSLWDRGEFVGKKRVSDSGHPRLKARRVGLAAAQLARQLRARRLRQAGEMQKRRAEEEKRALTLATVEKERNLGLNSEMQSLFLTQGAWSLGPTLGLEFSGHHPVRFTTRLAWLSGSVPALSHLTLGKDAPHFSHLDLSATARYVVDVSDASEMDFGGVLAVSSVHFGGATEVDEIPGSRDTWTARAGFRLGVSQRLSGRTRGQVALTAGGILRRIPLSQGEARVNLGGLFVGFSVGVAITP